MFRLASVVWQPIHIHGGGTKMLGPAVLTDDQRSHFDRDGYLIFDPGISVEVLDRVILDLQGKYTDPDRSSEGVFYSVGRIQDAWKISPSVKEVALASRVLATLDQLYGRRALPFQTLNFPRGTEQAAHSDTIHFNSMPATYMCGVWVALEDIDMDVGPLVYYRGSHKLPEITLEDLHLKFKFLLSPYYEHCIKALRRLGLRGQMQTPLENIHGTVYVQYYEPFVADLVARQGIKPTYATIKKGQALVWAANLLHGGSHQKDKSRSRHSQVTHYFFEGCKYYTPLLERRTRSFRKQVFWRNPEGII